MKINTQILVFVLSITFVIFTLSIGYVSISARNRALQDARTIADISVRELANEVKAQLNNDLAIVRTLGHVFSGYTKIPVSVRTPIYDDILRNVFLHSENYLAVWNSWEMFALDSTYLKNHGRKNTEVHKQSGILTLDYSYRDLNGPNVGSLYYRIKINPGEVITPSYFYSYNNDEDSILESSLVMPIMANNRFVGVAGIDVSLSRFQQIINRLRPFPNSFSFMLGQDGKFIAHPNNENLGKALEEVYPEFVTKFDLLTNLYKGKNYGFITSIPGINGELYVTVATFTAGKTTTPWAIALVVPVDVIMQDAYKSFTITLLVGSIGLIFLIVSIYFISRSITKPLKVTTKILQNLERGIIDTSNKLNIKSNNEIGVMSRSLNTLIDTLDRMAKFATQIGKGNIDTHFELLSDKDILGNALIEMQKSLKIAKEEETIRKAEDQSRNWTSNGLAKFSNILRGNYTQIDQLTYEIIKTLVKYLDAGSGGIFIINKDVPTHPFFELSASYAYDRKKLNGTTYEISEGYLGACYNDKKTLIIENVNAEYIKIGTGLGSAKPKTLLLVPIQTTEEMLGILEIASFITAQTHHIEFIENIASSIAITMANIQSNIRTAKLLEQARTNEEMLAQNEKTLEATINEMKQVQTDAMRHQSELLSYINALYASSMVAEYNLDGQIIHINDLFLNLLGLKYDEIMGKKYGEFELKGDKTNHETMWMQLRAGETIHVEQTVQIRDNIIVLKETYTPILDSDGKPYKVLNIAIVISKTAA